jgi:hypothetical protein
MANLPQVAATYDQVLVTAFDVHKPDKLSGLFNRYGDQGSSWFVTLDALGFGMSVAAQQYSHYENELKNPTFRARAGVAAPGTGVSQLITLAVADLDTSNRFYPRQWEIVNYKGGQKGIITSIDVTTPSAPVLTIAPIQAGAAYALPIVATNEELSLVSNAHSEASGQPKGVVPGAVERVNYTQIMKETLKVTGSELTNQTWMDGWMNLGGKVMANGQVASGNTWYNINQIDMDWRMNKQISGALLFGESSDGSIIDSATGNPIYMTQGLIPTVEALGNGATWTPGNYSVTDFDAYSRTLDREYAPSTVTGLLSKTFCDAMENTLVPFLANTNINYEEMTRTYAGAGKEIAVEFSQLKKSGRTFNYKAMMEFSDRQTFGIEGSVTDTYALWIPVATVKDAKSGLRVSNIGYRYKEKNGYSRKMENWVVNGAGPGLKVSEYDLNASFLRCEIGAMTLGANQMILVQAS